MADPLGGFVPDTVKNDEPVREPIVRLGKVISDRAEVMLGLEKITKESPEYCRISVIFYAVKRKRGRSKPFYHYDVPPLFTARFFLLIEMLLQHHVDILR